MRILRLILHSVLILLGFCLFYDIIIPKEFEKTLTYIVIAYTIGIIGFSMLKEISVYAFPRHVGIAIVLSFFLWELFTLEVNKIQQLILERYILLASLMVISYHLIVAIINNPYSFEFRKMGTRAFRQFYWPVYVIYFMIITSAFYFFYNLDKNNNIEGWHYSLAILLGLFPYYNKNRIRALGIGLQESLSKYDLKISFNQLGKLSKIRNFVFVKDKLIESGDFQLIDSNFRTTVQVSNTFNLVHQLTDDWNKKYSKLFVKDEFASNIVKYDIVTKNEDGITVVSDNAAMYRLGKYSYVKDKVKRDDKANLYLLKNDLPVAQFIINERIDDEKAKLVNQMDYFGNTILFNQGLSEDLGRDYEIVFDKIYSNLNDKKVNDILSELNKRAPTAYISALKPDNIKSNLIIHLSENLNRIRNGKLIECDLKSLLSIPHLIKQTKKVSRFLRYGLYISLLIQLILLTVAILFYKNILTILALNLSFAAISELILRIFSERLKKALASDDY